MKCLCFNSEWKTPIRDTLVEMILEAASFQIKTDSKFNSGDLVHIFMTDDGIYVAGGIQLYFTDPMQFELERCTEGKRPVLSKRVWLKRGNINMIKEVQHLYYSKNLHHSHIWRGFSR